MELYQEHFVYGLVRVALGVLFFFQAYDKIFRIGLKSVYTEVQLGAGERRVPEWFTRLSVSLTSYIELIGGILLMAGLFTLPVLYVFGVHIVMIFVGFGYLKGIWDLQHVFPRFAMLVFLLSMPLRWNHWSVDYILGS